MTKKLIRARRVSFCFLVGTIFIHYANAWAQFGVQLDHVPVTRAVENKPLKIKVGLQAFNKTPVYVRVYFRALNEDRFRYADLKGRFYQYEGSIPAQYVQAPGVQYFLLALFPDRTIVSLPSSNPYGRPFEVLVEKNTAAPPVQSGAGLVAPAAAGEQLSTSQQERNTSQAQAGASSQSRYSSAFAQVISPEPGEEVDAEDVIVAVSFAGNDASVDPRSIVLVLDGYRVTSQAQISEYLVTLESKRLSPGKHTVALGARDRRGKILQPLKWSFYVRSQATAGDNKKELQHSGRAFAEYRYEKYSGRLLETKNAGAYLDGSYGDLSFRGDIYITSLESSRLQPRNRFTLHASSDWFELGVGDLYPYFNELVLWGRRLRGFAGSLKSGIVNVEFVTGQSNRLIDPIYGVSSSGLQDSVTAHGTYRRSLTAARLSFGSRKTFQLGLLGLKVKDDPASLKSAESRLTPKDNLVAGVDLYLALDKNRIKLQATSAFSLFTNDISGGPASKAQVDSIFNVNVPFDPANLEKFIVLNESTMPLDPAGLSSLAYKVALQLNYFKNYFQVGFKRLGPQYTSLGQSFLRNNIKGFFVSDRVTLMNNRVFATLGYEDYKDNFGREDENPAIGLRGFNFGLSWYPGTNLPVVNLSLRNNLRDNGIDDLLIRTNPSAPADTIDRREQSLTRDFNFSVLHNFNALNLRHHAILSVTYSRLIDAFQSTRQTSVLPQDFSTTVSSLTFKSELNHQITTTLTFMDNSNQATGGLNDIRFDMVSGRGDYRFAELPITLYGGAKWLAASGFRKDPSAAILANMDYKQTSILFGANLLIGLQHYFAFDVEMINFKDNGQSRAAVTDPSFVPNPSYKNTFFRIFYEYRLQNR